MAYYNNKKKIHVRHHKPTGHNKVIVGESRSSYDYMNTTHSEYRDKNHRNNLFTPNPKPNDIDPKTKKIRNSYYERRILNDVKSNFSKNKTKSWKISDKDLTDIIKIVMSKKK